MRWALTCQGSRSQAACLYSPANSRCTLQETDGAQPAHTSSAADPEAGRPAKRARTPPRVHAPHAHPTPTLDTCGSSPEVGAARPLKRRVILDDSEDDATPLAAPALNTGAPRVCALLRLSKRMPVKDMHGQC